MGRNQRYRGAIAIDTSYSKVCFATFGMKTRCAPSEHLDQMDKKRPIDNDYEPIERVFNLGNEELTLDYETCNDHGRTTEQSWLWLFRNKESYDVRYDEIREHYPNTRSDDHEKLYKGIHPVCILCNISLGICR